MLSCDSHVLLFWHFSDNSPTTSQTASSQFDFLTDAPASDESGMRTGPGDVSSAFGFISSAEDDSAAKENNVSVAVSVAPEQEGVASEQEGVADEGNKRTDDVTSPASVFSFMDHSASPRETNQGAESLDSSLSWQQDSLSWQQDSSSRHPADAKTAEGGLGLFRGTVLHEEAELVGEASSAYQTPRSGGGGGGGGGKSEEPASPARLLSDSLLDTDVSLGSSTTASLLPLPSPISPSPSSSSTLNQPPSSAARKPVQSVGRQQAPAAKRKKKKKAFQPGQSAEVGVASSGLKADSSDTVSLGSHTSSLDLQEAAKGVDTASSAASSTHDPSRTVPEETTPKVTPTTSSRSTEATHVFSPPPLPESEEEPNFRRNETSHLSQPTSRQPRLKTSPQTGQTGDHTSNKQVNPAPVSNGNDSQPSASTGEAGAERREGEEEDGEGVREEGEGEEDGGATTSELSEDQILAEVFAGEERGWSRGQVRVHDTSVNYDIELPADDKMAALLEAAESNVVGIR